MSYRPSNYLQLDNYDIVEISGPGYCANACRISADKVIPPGGKIIIYGNYAKAHFGLQCEDLLANVSYVVNDPNLVNANKITDLDWWGQSYAYDVTSTIPGNSELNLITYNLGTLYNEAFILLVYNYTTANANSIYLRIYTSPDNTNWTQIYSITRSDTNVYIDPLYTSTPFQYIQLRIYNSSSASATNGFPVYIRELEVYSPLRTSFVNTSKNSVTCPGGLRYFVYNGYYQILEVVPIQ